MILLFPYHTENSLKAGTAPSLSSIATVHWAEYKSACSQYLCEWQFLVQVAFFESSLNAWECSGALGKKQSWKQLLPLGSFKLSWRIKTAQDKNKGACRSSPSEELEEITKNSCMSNTEIRIREETRIITWLKMRSWLCASITLKIRDYKHIIYNNLQHWGQWQC